MFIDSFKFAAAGGGGAPAFGVAASEQNSNATHIEVTTPAHASGAVALIALGYYSSSNETETVTGTMTEIDASFANNRMSVGFYYSVLDGTARTFELDIGAAKAMFAHVVIFNGIDNTTPIHKFAIDNNTSFGNPSATPSITPTVDGCPIVVMLANHSNSTTLNKPTMTDILHQTANNLPSYSGYEIQATAAAISKSYGYSASAWYQAGIFALNPA